MKVPTDFGKATRKPKKKDDGGNKLSVKVKGAPAEVQKVLGKMAGAGDMPMPGPRGPRGIHPMPQRLAPKGAPLLAKPLGDISGRKPKIPMKATGAGDNPAPLIGGAQPDISVTRLAVYRRSKKPGASIKTNNLEGMKSGPGGVKQIKPLSKMLNPFKALQMPGMEPPKTGGRAPKANSKMPPGSSAIKPVAKITMLKIRRGGK